jgi:hypothetical protein
VDQVTALIAAAPAAGPGPCAHGQLSAHA